MMNRVSREAAKAHRWKSARGFVFKAIDSLFFAIVINGVARSHRLSFMFMYKLLAFDSLFWQIVRMPENEQKPLSFRACGVWTAPMRTIFEGMTPITSWERDGLLDQINNIVSDCGIRATDISNEIDNLDDNLRFVETVHQRHMEAYPGSVMNIWRERVLTSILKSDYEEARRIIRDRINAHDGGGFQVGKHSFYQLADQYLNSLQ